MNMDFGAVAMMVIILAIIFGLICNIICKIKGDTLTGKVYGENYFFAFLSFVGIIGVGCLPIFPSDSEYLKPDSSFVRGNYMMLARSNTLCQVEDKALQTKTNLLIEVRYGWNIYMHKMQVGEPIPYEPISVK
jgi:hypothetical protein